MNMNKNMNKKGQSGIAIVALIAIIICAFVLFAGYDKVGAGKVGVTDTFGVVGERALEPGLHWTGVFTSTKDLNVRVQRHDYLAGAASRDLQTVSTQITVNFKLNAGVAPEVYKTIGPNYGEIILEPIVQEVVKSSTAKFTAEELITRRTEITTMIANSITTRVQDSGIIVTEVSMTDFDFSKVFNDAIESKQSAEQDAFRALNEKKKAITQAEAKADSIKLDADAKAYAVVVEAEAEAYALQVVREELSKSSELIDFEIAKGWDGKLPTYMPSSENGMLFNLPVGN